jgi:hypothetical protein
LAPGYYAVLGGCGSSCPYLPTLSANLPIVVAPYRQVKRLSPPHRSEWHVRIPKTRSTNILVLRVTKQDMFTRGNRCPARWDIRRPVLKQHLPSRGFVPRRHSTPRPLPVTCTRHKYLSHGKRPGNIPQQDLSSRLIVDPARSTRPSPHTQDTRQDLHMFIIRFLSGYWHLVPYLIMPLTHHHHITYIMRVRVKQNIVSERLA